MREQTQPDEKFSQLTPTFAIVALLAGLFVVQDTVFNPTRPSMLTTEIGSSEDVRSRLWQDPFQAVEAYRKKYLENNKKDKQHGDESIQNICKTDENQKVKAHSIEELNCQIDRDTLKKNKSLNVIAVMTPGGPYAEDQEWRLRSRYALISGLDAAGYKPIDSEHIGFVDFEHGCPSSGESDENDEKNYSCSLPAYMPFEWFELVKSKERKERIININGLMNKSLIDIDIDIDIDEKDIILVLWLNNDTFSQNRRILESLAWLKSNIISNKTEISFNVIGPVDSGTLKQIVDLEKDSKSDFLAESLIISPFASIDDKQLFPKESGLRKPTSNTIVRTITTHSKLANILLCELALRGVTPYKIKPDEPIKKMCEESLSGFPLKTPNQPHHIILIGEIDTKYSQTLTDSISQQIDKFGDSPKNKKIVHIFNYLRGLDGITTERPSDSQKSDKNKSSETNKLSGQETKERPIGPSQLDYLLGLVERIKYLDKKHAADGGIKAIGITGSDAYDKLLILQALRKQFPDVLFFTTDLDARLVHSTETKWTRNLIVASPFGLQLNDEWQQHTPPFRDSYQTSLYLATLFAIRCSNGQKQCPSAALDRVINKLIDQPRLFEVGNHGAVDLSHTLGNGIHPAPEFTFKNKVDYKEIIFQIGAMTTFMFFLLYLVPKKLRPVIGVASTSIIFLALLYLVAPFQDGFGSESLSFTNGTSIWPANGIRFLAVILAIYFIIRVKMQLRDNVNEIKEKFNENKDIKNNSRFKTLWSKLFIDKWKIETNQKNPVIFKDIYSDYIELRGIGCCSKRVMLMFLLYMAIFVFLNLAGYLDIPETPFRGETSLYINQTILFLAVSFYLLLTFCIADISHLTSCFIKRLSTNNVTWGEITADTSRKYGLSENIIKNKILMDFIYLQANTINNFIYYPFFILFLLIVSRSSYFDNWHITPLLLFIFIFTALITLGSAIRLRRATEVARDDIVKNLEGYYLETVLEKSWFKDIKKSGRIKLIKDEIKNLQGGAFTPLSHHPIVLSLLMPFTGVGGLYLIEYFAFSSS